MGQIMVQVEKSRSSRPERSRGRWLASSWRKIVDWCAKVAQRLLSASKLFENIALLTILGMVLGSVAAIVGAAMRHFQPNRKSLSEVFQS
jgi:hypothetical protein